MATERWKAVQRVKRAAEKEAAAVEALHQAVAAAKAAGATWEVIGETLGVTAQAAHKRFARWM